MRLATFISWLVTASLGAFMLRTWLARGGLRRERERADGLPPQVIFGHATLAITGLLIWAAYLGTGTRALAWTAVGILMVTVGLGLSTVTLWAPYPVRPAPPSLDEPAVVVPDTAAGAADAADPLTYQVTDEMIARLLADPAPRPGRRPIRPDPALLIPVTHGLAAMTTFVLAVMAATL